MLRLRCYQRKQIENRQFRSNTVSLTQNFTYMQKGSLIIFARIVGQWMPYNSVTDSFTQRNFVADFLQAECDYRQKSAVSRFWAPFGGLGTTYDNHLRLTGKHVVDLLLVLIELFSLRVMAEALRANIVSKSAISLQWGPLDPKFQVEGIAPTIHSSSSSSSFCHNACV